MTQEPWKEKAWAYVHGELPEEELPAFEAALRSDPELAAEVAEARKLDRCLAASLPREAETDDAFEDRVLSAWERDQVSAAGESFEEQAEPPAGRLIDFVQWLWRPSFVALAACLVLAAGIFMANRDPVHWSSMQMTMAVYRGEGAPPPALDPASLEDLPALLEREVDLALEEVPGPKIRATLEGRIIVQPDGAINVLVTSEKGLSAGLRWEEVYESPADFRAGVGGLSAGIAAGLADAEADP